MFAAKNLLNFRRKHRKIAHIDCVAGSLVKGWAFDRQNSDYQPLVQVWCDGRMVGEGVADEFRQDLKDAGYGDGAHGFTVSLNQSILNQSVLDQQQRLLTLIDGNTGINMGANECSIGGEYSSRAKILGVSATGITGTVSSDVAQLAVSDTVCVFMDDDFACSGRCLSTANALEFRYDIPLPPEAFDGKSHRFVVSVAGHNTYCDEHTVSMPAVRLPSEQLGAGSKHRGYASRAVLASYRYESLRANLRSITDQKQIENLNTAHDLVVEGARARKQYPDLSLPRVEKPTVSVVVPVYNQFALTYHCIASCILAANKVSYELIVVDDCSTDETALIEEKIENLQVIRNEKNCGFVRSCNRGAAAAAGEFIVFLNNDTEVTSGWIDELVNVFTEYDSVGAVGSKLIYPDGVLQDAGGVVWDNGLPWNAGNGGSSEDPQYNYTRDVDYLTGASLMVSQKAWTHAGGFDECYVPAYYEDTDLSFRLRDLGYRTIYCPLSTVVHFEGQSNGTDTASGVKQYQITNAETFKKRWQSAFEGLGKEGVDLHLNKDRARQFRVLMIDHAFPCEGLDAGSYAAIQEIKLMIALGCKITFVPQNFAHLGMYTEILQRMGVECVYSPFCTSMEDFLVQRGAEFDAVYITRYGVAEKVLPAIRENCSAKILFNNADLHFLREMRAAEAAGETDMTGPLQTREREVWVMKNVDAVLSYNETEHSIISMHTKRSDNIFKCPWVLQNRYSQIDFSSRKGIAFLGGFGHPPNREGVEYFIENVVPLLRETGINIPLHIYGSSFPEELTEIASEDIIVEGFVESLDTLFNQRRVFIAPLLSGAGIKGKVLDSMAYGVPSVLTPVAAEATGLRDGVSALIVETPEQWANAIVQLYTDEKSWTDLREAANDLVQERYSFDSGVARMAEIFSFIGLDVDGIQNHQSNIAASLNVAA
ncbi:MAG: glycosyltransferase [Granulosicoccus sp.]|nr:glycosyltransferase [Granulosicoccus sp.]